MESLWQNAIWSGISPKTFWELTPHEILSSAKIKQEKHLEFIKTLAWLTYNGAALISVGVNAPKKFPSLEDSFPSLFEKKEQQDWWVMKERLNNYSKAKNKN